MAHGLEITGVPVANEEDIQDPDMIQTSISLVPSFGAPGDATRFRVVFGLPNLNSSWPVHGGIRMSHDIS